MTSGLAILITDLIIGAAATGLFVIVVVLCVLLWRAARRERLKSKLWTSHADRRNAMLSSMYGDGLWKTDYSEIEQRVMSQMVGMRGLWMPIHGLKDKHSTRLLLCAPELVDPDCNEAGVGVGYWLGGQWFACRYDMANEDWYKVRCEPTHYLMVEGPGA